MMNPYYKVYIFVYLISRSILVNPECLLKVADKVAYEGCFVDSDTRLLPYEIGSLDFMTNDVCLLVCADKGYAFAGTERYYPFSESPRDRLYEGLCRRLLTDMWRPLEIVNLPYRTVASPGTTVSSNNKTDPDDINEILLKVVLNTINQPSTLKANSLKDPHKAVYEVLRNDVALLATPLETISIEINGLRAAIKCATLCSENDLCNVFSMSTDSHQCQLYTYRNTCDGYTSTPNSSLYARLLAA